MFLSLAGGGGQQLLGHRRRVALYRGGGTAVMEPETDEWGGGSTPAWTGRSPSEEVALSPQTRSRPHAPLRHQHRWLPTLRVPLPPERKPLQLALHPDVLQSSRIDLGCHEYAVPKDRLPSLPVGRRIPGRD